MARMDGAVGGDSMHNEATLLRVDDLRVHFPARGGAFGRTREPIKAVDGVSFHINRGETLGLVGESGCGKTTVGRAILRLIPATNGRVMFENQSVLELGRTAL